MKKILIFGDSQSVFIKDFIAQYARRGHTIDLISYGDGAKISGVRKQYNYMVPPKYKLFRHIKLYSCISNILGKLDQDYDTVVIHFVHFYLGFHILKISRLSTNLVAVVWGSDFYRVNSKTKKLIQNLIYRKADSIVFTSPATKKEFLEIKKFISHQKLKVARFGLPVLDEIDTLLRLPNYKKWCSEFKVPDDKLIIAVGYNANLAHQQLLIIDHISQLSSDILSSIHLIFPLGYGNERASGLIKRKLSENKIFNYTILDNFYNPHDIAKLRIITNILINVQPSDQFSASMQETLYSGNKVIAGSWLPYEELIANGAPIYTIESLCYLNDTLTKIVVNSEIPNNFDNNKTRTYISKSSSWANNIGRWDNILFKEYDTEKHTI